MSLSYILNPAGSTAPKGAKVVDSSVDEPILLPLEVTSSLPSFPSTSEFAVPLLSTPSQDSSDSENASNSPRNSGSSSEPASTSFIPDFSSDLLPYSLSHNSKNLHINSHSSCHDVSSDNSSRSHSSAAPSSGFEHLLSTMPTLSDLFSRSSSYTSTRPQPYYHGSSNAFDRSSPVSQERTELTTLEDQRASRLPLRDSYRREHAPLFTHGSSNIKPEQDDDVELLPKHRAVPRHPKMALSHLLNTSALINPNEAAFSERGTPQLIRPPGSVSFASRSLSPPLYESETLITPSPHQSVTASSVLIHSPIRIQPTNSTLAAPSSSYQSTRLRASPIHSPYIHPNRNVRPLPPTPEPVPNIPRIDPVSTHDFRLDTPDRYTSHSPLASPITTPPSSPPLIPRTITTAEDPIMELQWATPPPAGLSARNHAAYQRSGVHWMLAQIFGSDSE